jgi:hypothetical protein
MYGVEFYLPQMIADIKALIGGEMPASLERKLRRQHYIAFMQRPVFNHYPEFHDAVLKQAFKSDRGHLVT